MSKKEAREIIMKATQDAIRMYNSCGGDKADFDNRLDFINTFIAKTVPENIRKLAI